MIWKPKNELESFQFHPIAYVKSPFRGRFAVPRQPGMTSEVRGFLKFAPDPDLKTALYRLEEFSHIWVLFVFHAHGGKSWKPSIRPPRLGGREKVGVLASRSPHRPNPIGISVLKLESVDLEAEGGPEVHVSGLDLLDGTPILDIKPYIAYADALKTSKAGWAEAPIPRHPVRFSDQALLKLAEYEGGSLYRLRELILEMLELDPRPAFQQRKNPVTDPTSQGLRYGFDLLDFDIKYEISENGFLVRDILKQL